MTAAVQRSGRPRQGATGSRSIAPPAAAKRPGAPIIPPPPLTPKQARTTPEDNGRGQSADKTLGWDWKVEQGRRPHASASIQWNGSRYAEVLHNDVPAPKAK